VSLAPDAGSISQHEFGPAGRALAAARRALALAGGAVFVALVAMSVVSIVGRKVAAAPIPGDVEMLQMSAASACACFFAYCHLMGGDVKVDFFTSRLSRAAVHRLDAAGSALYALVGGALAWRTAVGALVVRAAEETSVILGWPVWIAQALMVPGFVLMALAGLYMSAMHLELASRPRAGAARP
jgi:TRAP-type C4-dicarboxylate transport system permease small subunit